MAETLHVTQTVFISNITVLVTLNVLVLVITLNVLVLVVVFKVTSMFNLADNFNVSDSVVTLNVPVLVTLNVCPSFYFKCFISFCYFHCFYPSCVKKCPNCLNDSALVILYAFLQGITFTISVHVVTLNVSVLVILNAFVLLKCFVLFINSNVSVTVTLNQWFSTFFCLFMEYYLM